MSSGEKEQEPATRLLSFEELEAQLLHARDEQDSCTAVTRVWSRPPKQASEAPATRLHKRLARTGQGPAARREEPSSKAPLLTATRVDVRALLSVEKPQVRSESAPPREPRAAVQTATVLVDPALFAPAQAAQAPERTPTLLRVSLPAVRRTVLYPVLAVLVVGLAVMLVWPRGQGDSVAPAASLEKPDASRAEPVLPSSSGRNALASAAPASSPAKAAAPASSPAASPALEPTSHTTPHAARAIPRGAPDAPASPSVPSDTGAYDASRSPRTAVDLLMAGRDREALDAYRALALEPGAAPVYGIIVQLLERERASCHETGGSSCAD